MTTVEVLKKAKAVIQSRGWHQGWFYGAGDVATRPCCTIGALRVALGFDTDRDSYGRSVRHEHPEAYSAIERVCGTHEIGDWNDAPGRTKEEVLAAFDRAIELAEAAQ